MLCGIEKGCADPHLVICDIVYYHYDNKVINYLFDFIIPRLLINLISIFYLVYLHCDSYLKLKGEMGPDRALYLAYFMEIDYGAWNN